MSDAGSHRRPLPHIDEVLERITDAIVVLDRDLRCVYANARATEILGGDQERWLGRPIVAVYPELAGSAFLAAYERALAEQQPVDVDGWFAPLERWFEERVYPSADGLTLYARDVTARKLAELDLRRSEERYRVLTGALSDIVWRTDAGGSILQQADWGRITGGDRRDVDLASVVHPDDGPRVEAAWSAALRTGGEFDEAFRVRGDDGGWRSVRARGVPVREGGEVREWIGVVFDVTEEARAHEALRRAAQEDPLTGLVNRTVFLSRLEGVVARRDPRAAIVYVDVDRFKSVNDRFGHGSGDALLRAVAARLRATVRPSDVITRLSGDEFAILCDDLTGGDEAVAVAHRVLSALAGPLEQDERIRVSASVGVAVVAEPGADASAVLQAADAAMYRAKARGGGVVDVFDEPLRERMLRRTRVEHELRQGLEEEDGLALHFQPIVPLDGTPDVTLEALLRWRCRDGQALPAAEAVSVAEQTGLIHRIGRDVLAEACRQAAGWAQTGRPVRVAVNVSARQLARKDDLVADVRHALESSGLPPRRLTLEITETVLMEDMDHGEAALRALRELGVALEIDDFGVGYSSLSYLRRLPVDAVKLDRSFVAGLPDDAASARIVEAVVGLARAFDIRVTAEGVETGPQLEAVRAAGCDAAQGYLLARPVEAGAALVLAQAAVGRLL